MVFAIAFIQIRCCMHNEIILITVVTCTFLTLQNKNTQKC
nr:MAG TPA: hypothetical protein [Caudoviricetes sp.]